ncbi:TPA: hypothetical protein EYP66_16835 [Candidatus Poribacteria bacterium]|nr:hypothetical protein [Candidatus Poribacteria bacterium]
MTTIEELKLQKNSCEDLGLTVDAENIRQRIAKLESNLSGEMPTDSGMPSIPEKETSENSPDVAIVESPEVEAQETQTVEPKPQAAATDKKRECTRIPRHGIQRLVVSLLANIVKPASKRLLLGQPNKETVVFGGYEITPEETRNGFSILVHLGVSLPPII